MAEPNNDGIPALLVLPDKDKTKVDHGKKTKDFSGTVYGASRRAGVWVSRIWDMGY